MDSTTKERDQWPRVESSANSGIPKLHMNTSKRLLSLFTSHSWFGLSLYGQLNSITHYVRFCGCQKSCGEQIVVNISLVCFSLFIYAHITLLDS